MMLFFTDMMLTFYLCEHYVQGHYGCHWCWIKGSAKRLNRMIYAGHGRMLPEDAVGRGTTRPSYKPRTHAETVRIGKRAEKHMRAHLPDSKHPKHKSGILRYCPLELLPLFDLILDILPDMMHIIKGFWDGHFIPLFKGNRPLAAPKKPTTKAPQKEGETPAAAARRETPAAATKREGEFKTKVNTHNYGHNVDMTPRCFDFNEHDVTSDGHDVSFVTFMDMMLTFTNMMSLIWDTMSSQYGHDVRLDGHDVHFLTVINMMLFFMYMMSYIMNIMSS
jgi:hypothetical protein